MPRAFVTGGGRGIGFAIATKLAEEGYSVTITGRDQARLEKSITLLPTKEGQHHKFLVADYADLTKPIEIDEDADLLVNNAGGTSFSMFADLKDEDLYTIVNTDYTSVARLSSKFIANCLKHKKAGEIFTVSSNSSFKTVPGIAVYGSMKAALNNLTVALAKEYGAQNIKVNAIAPGMTETDMSRGYDQFLEYNIINKGVFIAPKTIADAAWSLISNPNVTGVVLVVDNGAALP